AQLGQLDTSAASSTRRTSRSFQRMSTAMKASLAGVGVSLALIAKNSVSMAIDVQESESLFNVSMGKMANAARDWSKELSQSLGLNQFRLREQIGVIFNMTTSMGLARDQAFEMSKQFVELAQDMSSFSILPIEEAFQKLQSGISGEIEPLRRLGIVDYEHTTMQTSLRHRIIQAGEQMTHIQNVQARWTAITE